MKAITINLRVYWLTRPGIEPTTNHSPRQPYTYWAIRNSCLHA